jgi:hypothetical protein
MQTFTFDELTQRARVAAILRYAPDARVITAQMIVNHDTDSAMLNWFAQMDATQAEEAANLYAQMCETRYTEHGERVA